MSIKRMGDLQALGMQVMGASYPYLPISFDLSNAVGGENVETKQEFVFDVTYVSQNVVNISFVFNGVTYTKNNIDFSLNNYSYFGSFVADGDVEGDILISFYSDYGFYVYDEQSAKWFEGDLNSGGYYAINAFQGTDDAEQILGSANGELIYAEGGDDFVKGLGGNDVIYGGDGNDIIEGNAGNDIIYGGNNNYADDDNGNDTIKGGFGDDIIYGEGGDDNLSGGFGNDYIYGGDGDNIIFGNAGDDSLHGGSGTDFISGGDGDDYITSGSGYGDDILIGGKGNDEIHGSYSPNYADGSIHYIEKLYGGEGDDILRGVRNENYLYGGEGDDYLVFGEDTDVLSGGEGSDIFAFEFLRTGDNTITDFEQGLDKIYFEFDDHSSIQTFDSVQEGAASGSKVGYTHDLVSNQTNVHAIYDSSYDFNITLDGIFDLTDSDFIY